MERVTVRVPSRIIRKIDELVEAQKFPSRSEAVREALIQLLIRTNPQQMERTAEK